jgi:pre-60S factor REI1
MSSTFLVTEPTEKAPSLSENAEEEFERMIGGMQETALKETEPISERPTRRHNSTAEGRTEHPLSPTGSRASKASTTNGEISKADALRQCFFCVFFAADLKSNIQHMTRVHGLFIPERPYLVDLEGLIIHLSRKVHDDYQCLYCGRLKWSEDGIKTHMRDSSHCKIAYDTEEQQLDIGEFYDFRSTYSDEDDEDDWTDVEPLSPGAARGGGVKLGAKRDTEVIVDGEDLPNVETGEDEAWETDSTVSDVPTDELGKVYYDSDHMERYSRLKHSLHHSHADRRRHRSADGWHSHAHSTPHAVYHDEFELHLPSGRTAGHRSLNRYFRQNLRSYPSAAERAQRLITDGAQTDDEMHDRESRENRGRARGKELVSRADGGLGMLTASVETKRQVRATEKREKKREQRVTAKYQWKVDAKGNQQQHYRDPLLQ